MLLPLEDRLPGCHCPHSSESSTSYCLNYYTCLKHKWGSQWEYTHGAKLEWQRWDSYPEVTGAWPWNLCFIFPPSYLWLMLFCCKVFCFLHVLYIANDLLSEFVCNRTAQTPKKVWHDQSLAVYPLLTLCHCSHVSEHYLVLVSSFPHGWMEQSWQNTWFAFIVYILLTAWWRAEVVCLKSTEFLTWRTMCTCGNRSSTCHQTTMRIPGFWKVWRGKKMKTQSQRWEGNTLE